MYVNKIYKSAVAVIISLTFTISGAMATPYTIISDWARESVETADRAGIIPSDANIQDYKSPITRGQIASLISNAYTNITGNAANGVNSPFSDVQGNPHIALVHSLGIMNGRGDGIFDPSAVTTRQEMAKIILTFRSVANGKKLDINNNYKLKFTDESLISDWAKPYVSKAVNDGIINGYDDGTFGPTLAVTWEQAIALIVRSVSLNEQGNAMKITWKGKQGVDNYTVKITECRMSRYEGDIPPNEPVIYQTSGKSLTFYPNPKRKYTVEITGDGYSDIQEHYIPAVDISGLQNEIIKTDPTTKEEADALMTTVTIPIWKLGSNGEKYSSTVTITVHYLIADKVKAVFEEIYAGDEKFPIKDIGAYSWRGGRSEHNSGTAIDINANENYCIYNNGTTIGSHWKPYIDPYSITPYGDVMKAFEKYGFTWGGDSWSNPKDYMHFSYLGT